MRLLLLIPCLLLVLSCKKETHTATLNGLYVENTPQAGRSQLNFIGNSRMVISESASSIQDTFSFTISNGKIILTPVWTNTIPGSPMDFEQIDNNTIRMESIYPKIPEDPKTYMVFRK